MFDDSTIPVSDALLRELGFDAPNLKLLWALRHSARQRAFLMLIISCTAERCPTFDVVEQENIAHSALELACAMERPQTMTCAHIEYHVQVLTHWGGNNV